ncbi:MAG TPA: hypothetical protein VGJ39_09745 [Vicinamibacterales bacterium]
MIRARFLFAATLVGAGLAAGSASAQAPAAPDFQPILAGKNFTPPIRGAADVEFVKPTQKRVGDSVVDTVQVRNASKQPIARLTVESIYYDKAGQVIANGRGFISGLLQPGEVHTVTVETPFSPRMNSSNYKFTHANGSVTPKRVDKIVDPDAKAPAAKKPAARTAAKK